LTEPEPQPLDTPEPAPEEAPEPEIVPEEEPIESEPIEETPVEEIVQVDEVDLETLASDTPVELSNGVVVTAEVAIAVQLLQDPAALLQEIFTNPAAALAALGSVGADMTEEEREESEKVIVAAVIAGNIATQAAATAGAVSAYRRKP
jgi:outer membrane biosynthesis protein TonB